MRPLNKKVIIGLTLSSLYIGLTIYYSFFAAGEEPTMNLLWVDGINVFASLLFSDTTGVRLWTYYGYNIISVIIGIIEWFLIGYFFAWGISKLIRRLKRSN